MNGYIGCIDCGYEYPRHILTDGQCGVCRHQEREDENTMTDFPHEFNLQVLAKDKAYKFVTRCFQKMGGTITDKLHIDSQTSMWKESKRLSIWFISEFMISEMVGMGIEKLEFWKRVQEEINNL